MQNAFLNIKLNRARLLLFFSIILLLLCPCFTLAAQPAVESEYRLKAAFLYNFAKYVTWPDTEKNGEKFIIGILGENPFGAELDIIQGKMINDASIEIRQYESIEEARDCSILFIGPSERENISDITNELKRHRILTVSDTKGYAHMGVMINLYEDDNRLRFEINNRAAESAGLKISSHLLRLGKIIEPESKDLHNEKIQ
jgi:hypothetical protein